MKNIHPYSVISLLGFVFGLFIIFVYLTFFYTDNGLRYLDSPDNYQEQYHDAIPEDLIYS